MIKRTLVGGFGTLFLLFATATLATAEPDYLALARGTIFTPKSNAKVKGRRHTMYYINRPMASAKPASFPPGLHPADMRAAYKMPANGGQDIIAIVDAFHLPTALDDFNTYARQFGLPVETSTDPTAPTNKVFQVVYAQGTKPADDAGWGGEIALDIETAHAMAPNAKIVLVEAQDNSDILFDAEVVAASIPGVRVISNSWGGDPYSGDLLTEKFFKKTGVIYMASSGDFGGVQSYPAMSPSVVGVGGTNLVVDSLGNVVSETAWRGSGGGLSAFFARPAYQNSIASIVGTGRGCPDISAVADPRTGAAVYSSYAFGGWAVVGGTSLACPVTAGITSVRGAFKNTVAEENARYYSKLGSTNFRDIVQGTAGGFTAAVGWDFITGCGSPVGLYGSKVAFNPATIAPFMGKNATGTVSSILTQDFVNYSIDGVSSPPYGTIGGVTTTVALGGVDAKLISDVVVGLTASSTNNNTTIQIHAWDYTKNAWVFVRSFQGSVEQRTWTTGLPSGDFMSGGSVKLLVRGLVPVSVKNQAFTLSIDQVTVNAFQQTG